MHSKIVIYSKWGRGYRDLPLPPPNPPAAKFASEGDACVGADTQIKFLYYTLLGVICYNRQVLSEGYKNYFLMNSQTTFLFLTYF